MLLALQDSGHSLKPVARRLKRVAKKHKGSAWAAVVAQAEKGACLCAYRVALMVEVLFGPELGPEVTTSVIRGRFPSEPEAFPDSGHLTGRPKIQNYVGETAVPNKLMFGSGRAPRTD